MPASNSVELPQKFLEPIGKAHIPHSGASPRAVADLGDSRRRACLHLWPRSVSCGQLRAISDPQFAEKAHLSSLYLRPLSWRRVATQRTKNRPVSKRVEFHG